MMALIPIVASWETKLLAQGLGNEFLKYQEQVHGFFPLRGFKG
jgi:protein-S-isoprenylcysteine O-methyltransferase Ste14